MKNIHLELGGNSPFIVFEDANIEQAAQDAANIKFRNCGQICINANRFLIHENVYDQFVKHFTAAAKAVKVGDGRLPETTMGPMNNQNVFDKVQSLVDDAVQKGAQCVLGGAPVKEGTLFYQPTVLTGMNKSMNLYSQEVFGPVAPCFSFSSEQEAIEMANDTEYGLMAYCYTENSTRAWRVARALESGTVCVNASDSFAGGPFGGYKQSGVGRESGALNRLDSFLETKTVAFQFQAEPRT